MAILASAIFACTHMSSLHEDFLAGGEKIYLVKTDSVRVLSGNKRVRIQCVLTNAYNVDKIWVFWNTHSDSMVFDYIKTAKDVDTVYLNISGLLEKSYIFDLYTKNSEGKSSIKVIAFGHAYGDNYQSFLNERTISAFSFDGVNANLTLLSSAEKERGTEVTYTKTTGEKVSIIVPSDSFKVKLVNFSPSQPLTYRTFYVPDSTAIDTFSTNWINYKLPFIEIKQDKTAWTVIDFDSQEPKEGGNPNGLARATIDGDLSTFWHTAWDLSKPTYPHFFTIDMGKTVNITTFQVFRRQGNGSGQTKHQFFVSEDGTTWIDAGTFIMDSSMDAAQNFRILSNPKCRYFKYVALEGPNFYAFLAEINVFALP